MDSCVCAAMALHQHEGAFLHVSYGQRTARRELRAFHRIAEFYGVERTLVCELSHLGRIGGSSLTDAAIAVEEADLERREIPSSYVPFRNAHFLSIATSWGEVLGARSIFIGAVFEGQLGVPGLPPRVLSGLQPPDRGRNPPRDPPGDPDTGHPNEKERNRSRRTEAGRSPPPDLVLLSGRRHRLWAVRQLRPAEERISGSRRGGPDSLSHRGEILAQGPLLR